jgi:hypothetical protein
MVLASFRRALAFCPDHNLTRDDAVDSHEWERSRGRLAAQPRAISMVDMNSNRLFSQR